MLLRKKGFDIFRSKFPHLSSCRGRGEGSLKAKLDKLCVQVQSRGSWKTGAAWKSRLQASLLKDSKEKVKNDAGSRVWNRATLRSKKAPHNSEMQGRVHKYFKNMMPRIEIHIRSFIDHNIPIHLPITHDIGNHSFLLRPQSFVFLKNFYSQLWREISVDNPYSVAQSKFGKTPSAAMSFAKGWYCGFADTIHLLCKLHYVRRSTACGNLSLNEPNTLIRFGSAHDMQIKR